MGWNINLYDGSKNVTSDINYIGSSLTCNYSACPECLAYWQAKRDYDGKTVRETIVIMGQVITKMLDDGIKIAKWGFQEPKPTMLEDMLCWLVSNYRQLYPLPRHWTIKLS